jgi:hypothetical protein
MFKIKQVKTDIKAKFQGTISIKSMTNTMALHKKTILAISAK